MSILSILICCDTLAQKYALPLPYLETSHIKMSEISKKQNKKSFVLSAGAVGMTEQRQVTFLHTFQGATLFNTKVIIMLKTRSTAHAKRPKCHWLWKILLGYHHPEKKIVLYQQQFCAVVHNNLNLSCKVWKLYQRQLQTPISTMGFFSFQICPEEMSKFGHVSWEFSS